MLRYSGTESQSCSVSPGHISVQKPLTSEVFSSTPTLTVNLLNLTFLQDRILFSLMKRIRSMNLPDGGKFEHKPKCYTE